jgi:hypothetical protein
LIRSKLHHGRVVDGRAMPTDIDLNRAGDPS